MAQFEAPGLAFCVPGSAPEGKITAFFIFNGWRSLRPHSWRFIPECSISKLHRYDMRHDRS
jgi:hypothetical protein